MSKYLIVALVLSLVLALWRIDSVSTARDQESARADGAEQREQGLEQVLTDERAIAKTQADIDTAYQKGITDGKVQLDSTLSDLRADVIRLRKRFSCPAASVQATAAGAPVSDDAEAGGLQREDAEFLVRLASDADAIALQLKACQAIVENDRAEPPTNTH